ncbi:MAG: UDP-N-acetylmuramoyl-tripeptide--D-alanyl-D-alanine ligase [Litorilinea sp.]|nr:MAG: UDP-N-acetylmuramoyl-tripeptide--D-alanyl-D-alanine ligase [Litorilinea sp.]
MGPVTATRITLHTLWQALTGDLPPLALAPVPIPRASLDSRAVEPGDLFIALQGQKTDGHAYIQDALAAGARAIICQPHGQAQAEAQGARVVDCTRPGAFADAAAAADLGRAPLAFVVTDSVVALQKVGGFQRMHRCHGDLRVIGITGSVGKTTTKELTAAVLRQRYNTFHTPGNLNSEQGLPLALLNLGPQHERAVVEMGMYALGEIHTLCTLARPLIGVITNVGPTHLSRLGTMERIAQAKSELVQALPSAEEGGVAILNWDDERVRAMADLTRARIFRYGLTPEADLWADEIESAGLEGIRFRFHYRPPDSQRPESLHVRVPLLGRHSVHTALRAAAVGLVEGLSWEEIVAGMQSLSGQLRLVVVPGINGCTVIDDTYNASPASTVAALNLLADLQPSGSGRRMAVLGDMLELGQYTEEGHKLVGRRAAAVVDVLVTVGELGKAIGAEAREVGFPEDRLHITGDAQEAIELLRQLVQADDLVLVKGSRAVGMDTIVAEMSLA